MNDLELTPSLSPIQSTPNPNLQTFTISKSLWEHDMQWFLLK